ncbi:hypothetical protein N7462_003850 [Penicillium macrosclerotiorum]|uniref:uncharacterized protein n=1 Tax=Penicillium macrosclerotiorum TaxID=303699 RepID=UPI002549A1A4|nr:uncharacterized protein N7462_003850 [Penicillium macrosclerotiorum]KAJ5689458.1 hypothetical protein N7462_003850 [Penicillium macrosclerotiorum]
MVDGSLGPANNKVARERTVYLFGQPIAHSLSPTFHNIIFRNVGLPWRYIRLDSTDVEDLMWLMHRDDFIGAAVTMPNKVKAMDCVDAVTAEAQKIGCINTIFVRSNLFGGEERQVHIGTNTDWIGIQRALLNAGPEIATHLQDNPALVIGGGATCRSAIYALTEGLGAKVVYMVNRDPEEAKSVIMGLKQQGLHRDIRFVERVEVAQSLTKPPIVAVSTVPDIAPRTDAEKITRDIITTMIQSQHAHSSARLFLEMCYDPTPKTYMATLAEKFDWKVIDGLDVMEHQAIEQAVLWTEKSLDSLPSDLANSAIRQALHR